MSSHLREAADNLQALQINELPEIALHEEHCGEAATEPQADEPAAAELPTDGRTGPQPYLPKEELIVQHRDIARRLAVRLLREWRIELSRDELDGIVDLALCEAAERFEYERGTRFTTFLYYYIRGSLLKTIDSLVSEKRAVTAVAYSASATRNERFDLEDTPEIGDCLDPDAYGKKSWDSPEDMMLRRERIATVARVLNNLGEREREVLRRAFESGESPSDIAQAMGCSRREVMSLHKQALEQLKKLVIEAGIEPAKKEQKRIVPPLVAAPVNVPHLFLSATRARRMRARAKQERERQAAAG